MGALKEQMMIMMMMMMMMVVVVEFISATLGKSSADGSVPI